MAWRYRLANDASCIKAAASSEPAFLTILRHCNVAWDSSLLIFASMYNFRERGHNVTIHDPIVFIAPERAVLKNHIIISEFAHLASGAGLYIGNHIHIATHTSIGGGGVCVLEDFVGFAAGSRIITGTDDIGGEGIPSPTVPAAFRSVKRSFVRCCAHSFIATNVVIHPGVTIGEGTVVGSGSVVTKDLDPWGVYIGNPLRRIKDRPRSKVLAMAAELLEQENVAPSDFSAALTGLYQYR